MSIRMLGAFLALAVAHLALAQPGDGTDEPVAAEYDAELAKRLGADAYGMRNFVLAILKTGPNDASIKGEERHEIFKGHFANMTSLAEQGKLALAGPFGANDRSFRGLFLFAVPTIEEARELAESDPAVRAGVFVVEYLPWYGSAAVMQVNDIHSRIQEREI